MNWRTFYAMLQRDGHVARRNLFPMLLQNLMQPLLLTFVFGRVLTSSGMMKSEYKSILLPGIMAISTREIEDRLLAPMETQWLAVEKIVAGMIQALVSGLVVIPAAWLTMGSGVRISFDHLPVFAAICLLVALLSAAGGLALGSTVGQTQIGLMYTLVVAPMMMFGCAYYPWSALRFAPVLQYAVLINPLVYASEGLRGALMPEVPHISGLAVVGALAAIDAALLVIGLRQFQRKTVG